MSGTLPILPKPKEAILDSRQPIFNSISSSGRRQARKSEGHLWEIQLKYDIMQKETIAPLYAFCASQGVDSFDVVLPSYDVPLGTISGAITCGAGTRGDSSVTTSGGSGVIKAGTIIKFANHSKVYMLSTDSNAGSPINFFPDLIEDVTNGLSIQYTNVPFKVFVNEKILSWKTTNPVLSKYDFKMIEAIS